MSYFAALAEGLGNVFSFPNILIPILGTLIAMIGSFLPGIGGASIAALLLLATIDWDPISVLLLFGALTGGATFMGSITAILFNIPGNSAAAAALLDGHALSRKGLARTAIATAATASALGSIVGVVALIAILPVVRPFILEFGPLERMLLGLWGLTTIIAVPNSSVMKAVAVTLIGLMCAAIGHDPDTALPRWTFGTYALLDGIDMVAMLLGFFTISEVIGWRNHYRIAERPDMHAEKDSVWAGIRAVFTHYRLMIRSSLIGTIVGIIPGVGGTVAGFVAYGQAIQTAKTDRDNFGKGDIRGLIAPESAVDAKDGGSLLPALAFGLPGSEAGVILVTVFAIHGLVPGTPMLTVNLSLTFTLIMALLLSNILTSVVGVAIAPALARLTDLRIDRLALPVLIASLVTIVQLNGMLADLYVAVAFGLFGYLLKHFQWPRVPFVIAFVLANFIEKNAALSAQLFELDRLNFFERPAAITIAGFVALSLFWMLRQTGQPRTDAFRKPLAVAFALAIALVSAFMAGQAIMAERAYSAYVIVLAVTTSLACLGVAVTDLMRPKPEDAATSATHLAGLPRSHLLPIMALLVFVAATAFFGLPAGTGILVAFWLLSGGALSSRRVVIGLGVGIAMVFLTAQYLDKATSVLLPDPLIKTIWN